MKIDKVKLKFVLIKYFWLQSQIESLVSTQIVFCYALF